jgi:hypothetical protein
VTAAAAAAGVGVYPVDPYYIEPPRRAGLIVGYASLTEGEIRTGIRRLGSIVRSEWARGGARSDYGLVVTGRRRRTRGTVPPRTSRIGSAASADDESGRVEAALPGRAGIRDDAEPWPVGQPEGASTAPSGPLRRPERMASRRR